MPFNRPALSDLKKRITSDLGTRILGVPVVLSRAVISVIGTVMAGAVHLVYGYIDWLTHQLPWDPAIDRTWLVSWASLWGVTPKSASYASGPVVFTGAPGSVLTAADTVIVRSDGILYSLNADLTLSGSGPSVSGSAVVTAQTPGSIGNCDAGTVLTLQSPATGVSPSATVDTDGIIGGFDPETQSAFQARLIQRIGNPPRGGSDADYVAWATSQAGVTRAWPFPKWLGAGTVGLAFVYDQQSPITPSSGQTSAMQTFINTQKPSHADVTVFTITAVPLTPTIHLNPDTPAKRLAVQAELQDLLTTQGAPSSTLYLSQIRDAIGRGVGTGDFALTVVTSDQTYTSYQVPTLGTITWV